MEFKSLASAPRGSMTLETSIEEYGKIKSEEQTFVIVPSGDVMEAFTAGLNSLLMITAPGVSEPLVVKATGTIDGYGARRYLDGGVHTMRLATHNIINNMQKNGITQADFNEADHGVVGIKVI